MAFKYIHTLFLAKANTIQMCSVWYWTCEKFYTVTQIIALTRKKLSITFSRWKMTEAWGCLINSTLEKNAHSNFVWNQHESINKIVFFFTVIILMDTTSWGRKKKKIQLPAKYLPLILVWHLPVLFAKHPFAGGDHFISQNATV